MRYVALTAMLFASTLLLLPLGCGGNGSGPDNTTTGDAGAGGSGSTGGTQGGGSSGQAGNTGGGGDQSGTTGRGGSASGEAGRGGATIAGSGGGGGTTVAGAGGDGNGGAAGTGNGGAAVAGSGGSGSGGRGGAAGGAAGAGGKGGGAAGGAAGTDTWANYAQGFFQTYCVSCHNDDNSGTATRDYHMLANVMSEKAKIACGVSKSQADWTKRGCAGSPAASQFRAGTGAKPSNAERDRLITGWTRIRPEASRPRGGCTPISFPSALPLSAIGFDTPPIFLSCDLLPPRCHGRPWNERRELR
jgi:hypothetical protein